MDAYSGGGDWMEECMWWRTPMPGGIWRACNA
jgi:hypothetical protein